MARALKVDDLRCATLGIIPIVLAIVMREHEGPGLIETPEPRAIRDVSGTHRILALRAALFRLRDVAFENRPKPRRRGDVFHLAVDHAHDLRRGVAAGKAPESIEKPLVPEDEIHGAVAIDVDRRRYKPAIPFAEIDRPPSAWRVFGEQGGVATMGAAGEIGEDNLLIAALRIETAHAEGRRRKATIVSAHREGLCPLCMDCQHRKSVGISLRRRKRERQPAYVIRLGIAVLLRIPR